MFGLHDFARDDLPADDDPVKRSSQRDQIRRDDVLAEPGNDGP